MLLVLTLPPKILGQPFRLLINAPLSPFVFAMAVTLFDTLSRYPPTSKTGEVVPATPTKLIRLSDNGDGTSTLSFQAVNSLTSKQFLRLRVTLQ
jgi:hypothetical protein